MSGSTTEPSTVTVQGQASRALPGNEFVAEATPTGTERTVTVEATDASGNKRTKVYRLGAAAGSATYQYDANGNLTQKAENGSTSTYTWNAENELVRVTKDGAEVARFEYDPLGRRVRKVAGGVTYAYLYDGTDSLRETRTDGTSYTYIHGPGIDEPLVRLGGSGGAYYHVDGLGSIVKMTDASGNVIQTRQYDAWGNLEVGASEPGYAFTGREWDPETGLYYYRARYYDPKVGRFISEDPIGFDGGINFHRYVRNAPTNLVDPLGLTDVKLPGGYRGRVDVFPAGEGASFEIHVYKPGGAEVGVLGPDGWINKHGFKGTPPDLPANVKARLNGRLIQELRRFRLIAPQGGANIKGRGLFRGRALGVVGACVQLLPAVLLQLERAERAWENGISYDEQYRMEIILEFGNSPWIINDLGVEVPNPFYDPIV